VPSNDRFELFSEVREHLARCFTRALGSGLAGLSEGLERDAETSVSALERRELFATAAMLRIESPARTERGLAAYYDLTFRLLERLEGPTADAETAPLALIADPDDDARILAETVAQAVRERLGARYEIWIRRIEGLTRTPSIDALAPLGAPSLAAAAVQALRPMAPDRSLRSGLRRVTLERLAPLLADAFADADDWLAARGAMPWQPAPPVAPPAPFEPTPARIDPTPTAPPPPRADPRAAATPARAEPLSPTKPPADREPDAALTEPDLATPVQAPQPLAPAAALPSRDAAPLPADRAANAADASSSRHDAPLLADRAAQPPGAGGDAPDASMARAAEALIHSTEVADLLGQQPIAPSASAESGYRFAGLLPRPAAFEQDAIAFAHHVGVVPYSRAARQQFFGSLRARMLQRQATPAHLAAHDLVAAMFDYAIDDVRIPEAAKPLLWRLQLPAVTLAALDAGFLGDDRRSIRRLVEHFSAIAVAYADDIAQGSELHRRLDTVVRAVEVICHAFQARSSVLGEQVRREYSRAAHGVAQLLTRVEKERRSLEATPARRNRRDFARRPSNARETEVTRRLEAQLGERVAGRDIPESVRDFLLGAWLRHLRTAVLRDGDESASYRLSMQVVDDLLWTLGEAGGRASRRHLARRIPPLLKLLTQGIRDIGSRAEEYQPFLDELFVIHLRRMQKVPRNGDDDFTGPVASATATTDRDDGPPTLQDRLPDDNDPAELPPTPPPAAPAAVRAAPTPAATAPFAAPARPATAPPPALRPSGRGPGDDRSAAGPPISPRLSMQSADRSERRAAAASPPADPTPQPIPPQSFTSPERRPSPVRSPPVVAPALVARPPPPLSGIPPPPPSGHAGPLQASDSGGAGATLVRPSSASPLPPGAMPAAGPTSARPTAEPAEPRAVSALPQEVPWPAGRPETGTPTAKAADDRSGDQRLLTVLSTVDLSDYPPAPRRLALSPEEALSRLRRGDWIELEARDGQRQEVKVAWINSRRTVVLLVRRPDRRALSLRSTDLHQRFSQRKATLLG